MPGRDATTRITVLVVEFREVKGILAYVPPTLTPVDQGAPASNAMAMAPGDDAGELAFVNASVTECTTT